MGQNGNRLAGDRTPLDESPAGMVSEAQAADRPASIRRSRSLSQGSPMKEKTMLLILGAVVFLGAGAALWGPVVSNTVEQPSYVVESAEGAIEIRRYAPMIVAEVEVTGEREAAINAGFRSIAAYIFGANVPKLATGAAGSGGETIAMTAPVLQQGTADSEKIAMTAPVLQQGDGGSWTVRFVMPAQYTLDTLPRPTDPSVRLREMPGKRYAAIRFSGLNTPETLTARTDELSEAVRARGLFASAAPIYAFYNPPWTLPFLRRNEVMLEVTDSPY
jgi:hypothetical protein